MSDTQQHAHYVAASTLGGGKANQANGGSMRGYKDTCGKCGARRVDQQIGLEATPDEFVARLVEVFREVRRVLHPTGTLWLNLGDSYNGSGKGPTGHNGIGEQTERQGVDLVATRVPGLKPKDLIGIPWMVAFALRADGWWLRQEIIWHKTAPMPESVTDRCTKAHEQVFLLAKSERYFFDHIAIMEPQVTDEKTFYAKLIKQPHKGQRGKDEVNDRHNTAGFQYAKYNPAGRNKRSVWTLGPESYSGAHYAVMPSKLVEPCVLSGSSAHGVCAKCLAPYERLVEREGETTTEKRKRLDYSDKRGNGGAMVRQNLDYAGGHGNNTRAAVTLGWAASCTCGADVVPATVLDCFCGSGTVLAVALKFGRRAIGIDLDPRNMELARKRIEECQPMLLDVSL